jgi:hypothetical protein
MLLLPSRLRYLTCKDGLDDLLLELPSAQSVYFAGGMYLQKHIQHPGFPYQDYEGHIAMQGTLYQQNQVLTWDGGEVFLGSSASAQASLNRPLTPYQGTQHVQSGLLSWALTYRSSCSNCCG